MVLRRVYVGDIGVITPPTTLRDIPEDTNLDAMTYRELYNLALIVGVNMNELLGLRQCVLHIDMVVLGGNKLPDGFNIPEDTVFCLNCWQQFRGKIKNTAYDSI